MSQVGLTTRKQGVRALRGLAAINLTEKIVQFVDASLIQHPATIGSTQKSVAGLAS
jgi:hypothetical protein